MYDFSQFPFFGLWFHCLWTNNKWISLDNRAFPSWQSIHIYLAPVCTRNFIMCREYINKQNKFDFSLYFSMKKEPTNWFIRPSRGLKYSWGTGKPQDFSHCASRGLYICIQIEILLPFPTLFSLLIAGTRPILTSLFVSTLSPSI